MKNNAYLSMNKPKDFLTVFGPHVLCEFPNALPKTAS